MRKCIAIMLACFMVLGMTACGGSAPAASTAPAASAAAPAAPVEGADSVTGKVVIYTSMYQDIIDVMDAKLAEVFPNCDIEFFYGGTGTLQSKVAAEMTAGKLGCDMLMVAEPAYSLELKENDILHPYKTPAAEKLSFDYDADGYWYPVRVCSMILAYNPELYKKEEIATTFKDFATKPELKDYVSMSNPLTSGTAMASIVALQDAYGTEYFKQLGDQNVAIESGSVALTKLETGECKEVMILEESVLKKRQEEGSTLEVIYPEDGVISIPSTIMTVNEKWNANQNIAACEAITDWFLSEEGQAYITDGWMHAVLKGFDKIPYDSLPNDEIFSKTLDIDWERCYKERDDIRTAFEENVTIPAK